MVIGIIGAGVAGLIAGKHLAQAGHSVVVFEKSRGFGGRLATRYSGKEKQNKVDHGSPYMSSGGPNFNSFIDELRSQDILMEWSDTFGLFDGENLYNTHPGREREQTYFAPKGMNSIGKYLSRWVDIKSEHQIGGITLVAPDKIKKRPWILNISNGEVFEADALIIATPATQAHGIIQTSQDEWGIRYLARELSKIKYHSAYSLILGYGERESPEWKGIFCQNSIIDWISNESSKRSNDELILLSRSNEIIASNHDSSNMELIVSEMTKALAQIVGDWALRPFWHDAHFWRYYKAQNYLDVPFLELEEPKVPLALIGDYFMGNDTEAAFNSGYNLAQSWINKYGH